MTIYDWARILDVKKSYCKSPADYMAFCPCCHDAGSPTLHVYEGKNGRIVMKCYACGATGNQVCKALGVASYELDPDLPHKTEHAVKPPISVDWNVALDMAASAVLDKITELTGDRQVASDQLIDALVGAFADRLGSMVSIQIMRDLEASTPPADKTDSAVGFEGSEKNG